MKRLRQNVIGRFGAVGFLVIMFSLSIQAQVTSAVNPVVDSLFIIASSGEVMHQEAREPAMDSIATYGLKVVPFLIEKLNAISRQEKWTALWILERIGGPSVPLMVAKLSSDDGLHVQRVCWALSRVGDSTAVEGLIGVMNHSRWQVREEALGALGKIADSRADEAVLAALVDTIGQVRKGAAVATGKLLPSEGVAPLIEMLADDFYGARMSALDALSNYDSTVILEALNVSQMSGIAMNLTCQLLGRIGSSQAKELLYHLTLTDDTRLRSYASLALIQADPTDSLGHQAFIEHETDRLNRLKLESALTALADEFEKNKNNKKD